MFQLREFALQRSRGMIFMHDGAPPHFTPAVRAYLNLVFPRPWFGRVGLRLPLILTQWISFYGGHMKGEV